MMLHRVDCITTNKHHLATSLSSLEDQSISAAFDRSTLRVVSLHDRTPRGQVITRYVSSAIHNFSSSTGATALTPWFSKFRMGVVARDGTCLVTDVMHSYCTSCHIVPLRRPDVSATGTSWRHPPQFPSIAICRHCLFLVRYINLSSVSIEILRYTKLQPDCWFGMTFIMHTIA
ncbi:hypothetical protein CNBK0020 [Cryptococcus deneoformans B-3501A]|uniref:hypothetical protein n=1 Tax=Cryptococcus deneoformans (strain B-3501A) TaxID=283643 RepID=UPI000042DE82|nr:hypothetical protein CNBK0020 [Cryptococcus neoformans var. neoformans B-3501A]EAL18279.1 hypothetical protein CNBK0020 [Cryptococcus neoformans var. neoformans B-3501A]